jgi:hypothetical protein
MAIPAKTRIYGQKIRAGFLLPDVYLIGLNVRIFLNKCGKSGKLLPLFSHGRKRISITNQIITMNCEPGPFWACILLNLNLKLR